MTALYAPTPRHGDDPPPRQTQGGWTVRVRPGAGAGLSPPFRKMLEVIEAFCRKRPYCYPGAARLARAYGCHAGSARRLEREMEEAGLIRRVFAREDHKRRLGIVLF